jgi:formylaminopyrimidine deformylase
MGTGLIFAFPGSHAVNEKVEIRQLLDFTKILAVFIAEWCNTRKEEYGNETHRKTLSERK